MLIGGLCENLESIHETEDEIATERSLLNLFSAYISPSTLGTVFKFCISFRMLWGMSIPILECQHLLRCKLEVGAEHK
jgi:hypothetical protein